MDETPDVMADEKKEADDVTNNPEASDVSISTSTATAQQQSDEQRTRREARAAVLQTVRQRDAERTGSGSASPMPRRQENQHSSDDEKQLPTTPVLAKQYEDIKRQDRSVERLMRWNEDRRKHIECRRERMREIEKARIAMEQRKFHVHMTTGELFAEEARLNRQEEAQEEREDFRNTGKSTPCVSMKVPVEFKRVTRVPEQQPPTQSQSTSEGASGNNNPTSTNTTIGPPGARIEINENPTLRCETSRYTFGEWAEIVRQNPHMIYYVDDHERSPFVPQHIVNRRAAASVVSRSTSTQSEEQASTTRENERHQGTANEQSSVAMTQDKSTSRRTRAVTPMTTTTDDVRNEAAGMNNRTTRDNNNRSVRHGIPAPRRNAQGELESYEDYVNRCRPYEPRAMQSETYHMYRGRRRAWEQRRDGRHEFERMWGSDGRTSSTRTTPDTENSRSVSPNDNTHVRRDATDGNPIRADPRAWFGIHRYFDKSNTMRTIERDVKKLSERFDKLMQGNGSKMNVNFYNDPRHRRRRRSSSSSETE